MFADRPGALASQVNLIHSAQNKGINNDNVNDNNKTDNSENFRYLPSDKAPYLVIIESLNSNIGNLNPLSIGKYLYSSPDYQNINIKTISRKGLKKVGIEFNSPLDANSFLDTNLFNKDDYRIFIPARMVTISGIVRDIGVDISESDILTFGKGLNPSCKVIRMRRFNRFITRDGEKLKIPTTTCLLTFKGKELPKFFTLFNNIVDVQIYIPPVVQCNKCLRFGHIRANCRGKFRCYKCGDTHDDESVCDSEPTCLYCGLDHYATDRSCKEYHRQKKIREIMAYYNLSFFEANKSCKKPVSPVLADFPSLSNNLTHNSPGPSSRKPSYMEALSSSPSKTNTNKQIGTKFTQTVKKNKRKADYSPGYDKVAHNNALLTYNPSYPSQHNYSQSPNVPSKITITDTLSLNPPQSSNIEQDDIDNSSLNTENNPRNSVRYDESFLGLNWASSQLPDSDSF